MVDIGIIGLAKSGKTTVFSALTGGKKGTGGAVVNVGVVKVPDNRLNILADIFHPRKVVSAEVTYHDIEASAQVALKEKGISGQLLAQLSNVDALINVVRAFSDDSIPHMEGSLDVGRDIATIDLELAFSDLAIIERRLQRIDTSLKGAKQTEKQALLQEQLMLGKFKTELENNVPIRELQLSPAEFRAVANYQFLTAKPLLILVNIGEDQLSQVISIENDQKSQYVRPQCSLIALCGELEMELAQLDENAASGFQAEFGIQESGLGRAIKQSYGLLGLISFLTVGSDEVRAWTIRNGTNALKAASKIHSDIERGFIRAEVISYQNLMDCGSLSESRKKGLLRLEGKDYIVQDGDVINFLFNV
ncbi:MAG: redox-regulated ATPase YchF [Dehalococcoidales bacterium]|nr:redox-regulated ATPase YchF [Dehalococcoidales bacterium]